MTGRRRTRRFTVKPPPGAGRPETPHSVTRKLGDMPDAALRALRDYGLSDAEIARYHGLSPASVRRLCRLLSVPPEDPAPRPPD